MEAMENVIAEERKSPLPEEYNCCASADYYFDYNKVGVRQTAFDNARSLFDVADPSFIDDILKIAKKIETYYLEGKTLADTVV